MIFGRAGWIRLSFLLVEADVHLDEEDCEVQLGEAKGDTAEAFKVPNGEAEGEEYCSRNWI